MWWSRKSAASLCLYIILTCIPFGDSQASPAAIHVQSCFPQISFCWCCLVVGGAEPTMNLGLTCSFTGKKNGKKQ